MNKIRAKIPLNYRLFIFFLILIAWLSGIGLYIFQEWIRVDSFSYHPFQKYIRRVHGAAAFLMMITYGYLLASHVPSSWKQRRLRISGLALLTSQFIMIITGYFIYYLIQENDIATDIVKATHLVVGLLFPTILIIHILTAIHSKPTRKTNKAV